MHSQAGRKQFLITGTAGSTGANAIEILTQQGDSVRPLVHREDERSARLGAAGAEVVVSDVLDLDDARRALEGVDAAYCVYPIAPGLIEDTAYFAQAIQRHWCISRPNKVVSENYANIKNKCRVSPGANER